MMMARWTKIIMTASVTLFALLVCFDNLIDYDTNFEFVRHVLSMDTSSTGDVLKDRAITVPVLWHAAYLLIIAAEGATGLLLGLASIELFRARRETAVRFEAAKRWAYAGATLGFVLWFLGFETIAGEWFAMWQSHGWNGQDSAFRFYMTLLAVLLVVAQPDAEFPEAAP